MFQVRRRTRAVSCALTDARETNALMISSAFHVPNAMIPQPCASAGGGGYPTIAPRHRPSSLRIAHGITWSSHASKSGRHCGRRQDSSSHAAAAVRRRKTKGGWRGSTARTLVFLSRTVRLFFGVGGGYTPVPHARANHHHQPQNPHLPCATFATTHASSRTATSPTTASRGWRPRSCCAWR